ncbi:unnamed protein product [Brassica oleracea var. botrytis]|uniref:(rape) hypothetical protein n=1 Tax=Brassica napus TaxID=3708 RepID=A0A816J6U0_BRANA|nr:unnamed protein product [Brassica napus]
MRQLIKRKKSRTHSKRSAFHSLIGSPHKPQLSHRGCQTDPTEHTTDDVPNKTSNRFAEHASSVNAFVATATSKRTSLPTLNMEQSQVLPAKPTPRHQPSDEECNLAEELLKCPSIPTLALIAPLPQQQWDLFHSTLTSNKQAFHITPSQFDFSNKFILDIAEPRKWVTTFVSSSPLRSSFAFSVSLFDYSGPLSYPVE